MIIKMAFSKFLSLNYEKNKSPSLFFKYFFSYDLYFYYLEINKLYQIKSLY